MDEIHRRYPIESYPQTHPTSNPNHKMIRLGPFSWQMVPELSQSWPRFGDIWPSRQNVGNIWPKSAKIRQLGRISVMFSECVWQLRSSPGWPGALFRNARRTNVQQLHFLSQGRPLQAAGITLSRRHRPTFGNCAWPSFHTTSVHTLTLVLPVLSFRPGATHTPPTCHAPNAEFGKHIDRAWPNRGSVGHI